jgi:hypothetical protein
VVECRNPEYVHGLPASRSVPYDLVYACSIGISSRHSTPYGIGKRHRDPWLGLGYLVCLGRDLWKELVAVVEGEIWGTAPVVEDPADEELQIDAAQSEDDTDTNKPGGPELSVRPEARHRRWAAHWDEDTIWGDPDPEIRRRLKRLLGGSLK